MPHVVYVGLAIMCPWPNCGLRIEMIDFQLERWCDSAFYSQVMLAWGVHSGYGLIARCPGCGQYVRFGIGEKRAEVDPSQAGMPVLADDWHQHADIVG